MMLLPPVWDKGNGEDSSEESIDEQMWEADSSDHESKDPPYSDPVTQSMSKCKQFLAKGAAFKGQTVAWALSGLWHIGYQTVW